jgi:MFS family permease
MFNNTTKLVLISFFSALYFYSHVGTLYLQSRSLNLTQVNSITSIIVATIFLTEVPTGVIADRIGRKRSVVMALLLQTIGEVWYIFASTYEVFIVIAIIAGLGFAFSSGAMESLIYDSLPPDDRETRMQKAMGNVGSAYNLGFFLAPLVGGLLVTEYVLDKYLLAIALTAAAVGVAFLISLTLADPPADSESQRDRPLVIFRAGIAEIRQQPQLRHIVLLSVFTVTFHGVLVALYQPYFVSYELSPFLVGAGLALGGLLAAVVQKYAYVLPKLVGRRAGLMVATVLPGLLYMLLAVVTQTYLVFGVFVLTYAALDLKKPLFSAYQNQYITDRSRATTLSLMNMLTSLYVAVMALVYGMLADQSVALAFMAMGASIVAFATILRVDKAGAGASSEI